MKGGNDDLGWDGYDLELLGFGSRDETETARSLATVFGISGAAARRYMKHLPVVVLTNESEAAISTYVQVMVALGADLRVARSGTNDTWVLVGGAEREKAAASASIELAGSIADIADDTDPVWMPSGSRDEALPDALAAASPSAPSLGENQASRMIDEELGEIEAESHLTESAEALARTLCLKYRMRSGEMRTYSPPDLSPERHRWVDRIPTVDFFANGLRRLREGAAIQSAAENQSEWPGIESLQPPPLRHRRTDSQLS